MRIILIGNYKKDRQESMNRFTQMLYIGLLKKGFKVEIWYPTLFFAYFFKRTNVGLGKWVAYIDKWLLFPIVLKIRLLIVRKKNRDVRVHICDHSNAIYLTFLDNDYASITCHDVLAIRAGLGFENTSCTTSSTGKILQRLILTNLLSADKLAAVSQFTLDQLRDLSLRNNNIIRKPNWSVIYNAFNAEFKSLDQSDINVLLDKYGISTEIPFILHVGSDLPRKNREMLVKLVVELGEKWNGNICFAGKPINESLKREITHNNLKERVFSIVSPDHELLNALYCGCYAFIFPSFSEGFGWPVIEAQACKRPVIASNIDPMPEIGGAGALYASPYDAQEFAQTFLSLEEAGMITDVVNKGIINIKRFDSSKMIDSYVKLMDIK